MNNSNQFTDMQVIIFFNSLSLYGKCAAQSVMKLLIVY
jgi:hypothetical protein